MLARNLVRMNLKLIISSTLAGLLIANPLWAQLAVWEVAGTSAFISNPLPATTVGVNINSASLALGGGLIASSSADTFGGSNFDATSLSSAISNGDYISITITPASGYKLSISSIGFNSGVSTATTNFNVSLLSNATGLTATDALHTYSFSSASAPAQSITLTSSQALQNYSSTIEFRLYGWRDASGTSTFRIRNLSGSDLVINGTVNAIPEPSTYAALVGMLALSGVMWQRQRWRKAKQTS